MAAFGQQPETPAPQQPGEKGPQVKYTYLNVCTPSDEEKGEITSALAKVPPKPAFSADFEVTRGRTSMENAEPAKYVRLRRDLNDPVFSGAQYSLSNDKDKTVEVLSLKLKDPKELFTVTLEDQLSSTATAPATALDVDTPVSRIKLERFGKSNLVLSRCSTVDQAAYEPIFQQASRVFAEYRKSLGLHSMFRHDITWLSSAPSDTNTAAAATKKSAPKATPKSKKTPDKTK
jgi:hypothetical protein